MRVVRIIAASAFAVCALLFQERGNAATDIRCVSNGAQLKQAFADTNFAAEGVGQDIRVRSTSITVDASLIFEPPGNQDNKDFALTGGWNSDCSVQTLNPANTLVTMTSADPANRQITLKGDNHSYTVRGIHFESVSTFTLNEDSCPNWQICVDTDYVTVEFNIFSRMSAFDVSVQDARSLTVRNNLFHTFSGSGTLVGVAYLNDELAPNFSFNTLADMHCTGGGAALSFGSSIDAIFHHNIIQSDCAHDLFLSAPGVVALFNNLYSTIGGYTPGDVADNLVNVDPGFVDPASDNYSLRTVAPVSGAIDAGKILVELVLTGLNFPGQDLYGNPRLVGYKFDLGAIESPGPAPAGYVVTNTNDSGSGSLRQAVYDANHAAGPQKITFNIPGACPRKIGLLSHLDDIVEDTDIDGYSQPGSVRNSADRGSSANLCVEVGPAAGNTIDYSLRVPDGAAAATNLQVRGIAFTGGHTSAALYLRGGSGHVIQGNAFGGVRPGGIDTLGDTNLFHLVVRANAQGVLIGGADNADRNYFGSSQSTALLLRDATSDGHIVRNNYIGLDPGGAVPQALGNDGVAIVDSGYVQVIGNVIDAGSSGISMSGPTASNISIRSNRIGIDAYGGQGVSSANGDGIYIHNGAHFNEIGAYSGKTPSNTIANNNYAGVRVDSTAGPNNTVRPNSIYGNGKSGQGLAIDLGVLGPLANDSLDADSGPNDGQNSPRLKFSKPNPDATRTISGGLNSLPNTSFRIDVYRSATCAGGNRGGDAQTLLAAPTATGATDVKTDATGKASFNVTVNGVGAPAYITAVATLKGAGGSSEIGACFNEDSIFSSGAEVEPL